jgi:hypothetical protein
MKNEKLPIFDLTKEGEILQVTFHSDEIFDYTEQQNKAIKTLAENIKNEIYIIDKNGDYKLLKKEQ